MSIITVGDTSPRVPVEIQDAVEKWARRWGRHGRVVYIDHFDPPWPQVRLTPVSDDPQMERVQKGKLPIEEAEETVELIEWDPKAEAYRPIPLEQLGASGVVRLLQKGNTWSGRGEYDSLQEAVVAAREEQKREQEQFEEDLKDAVKESARGSRRRVLDLPFMRMPKDVASE